VIAICLLAALISGCGTTWMRLDGSSADEVRLEQALKTCRVERKLEGLGRAEDDLDRQLAAAKTSQQKDRARQEYAAIERQVYREIDICMHKQGFRRQG
jgi:hypothetical protein